MTSTETSGSNQICRVGLISRIDYPSEGYRQALLQQAAEILSREDVHFIILAGGLIAARYVKDTEKKLKRRINQLKKQIKAAEKAAAESRKSASQTAKAKAKGKGKTRARSKDKDLEAMRDSVERFEAYLAELTPERLAEKLAKSLPRFTNAKGDTVKLYIFTSPAYDGEIGETVAQLLADARSGDVRVYQSGGDRMTIKQAAKELEVLVPLKSPWRGDYFSTGPERLLNDKRKQSNRDKTPDIYVVGCFGSTITKPSGELPLPYVTVPALHRLQEVRVNENQTGVRVMCVYRDRVDPVVRTYSLRDYIRKERSFIRLPKAKNPRQQRLLEALQEKGRSSASILGDTVNLSRDTVNKELKGLLRKDGRQPKNWPGLRFDKQSKRWDFDGYWVRENLQYPAPVTDGCRVDSIVAFGCPHFGSIYTAYRYFLETMPQVILDRDATVLVGAGDFVEGIKHNLILRGEVYGGLNVTQQEQLAGTIIAQVNVEVFKARFARATSNLSNAKPDQILDIVNRCLLTNVMIPGNHDTWILDSGVKPLVVMKLTMTRLIFKAVADLLTAGNFCLPCTSLMALVESKIIEPELGEYTLPSGLKMTVMHPYMGRAKTTSLRPQGMLAKAGDSHVVIGANFHVGEHLEMWDSGLGQRVCLQLGTIKRRSDFEDNQLKTVDHGFGYLCVKSLDGRVVGTEAAFYGGDVTKVQGLSREKVFDDLLVNLGLKKG